MQSLLLLCYIRCNYDMSIGQMHGPRQLLKNAGEYLDEMRPVETRGVESTSRDQDYFTYAVFV